MTGTLPAATAGVDVATPVARRSRGLEGLNPLAKFAAVIVPIAALIPVRDIVIPAIVITLAYLVLLVGAPLTRQRAMVLFVAVPVGAVAITTGMALWADTSRVEETPALLSIGAWTLYAGALESAIATALRITAMVALGLVPLLTTSGADLARALVQQARVPYRIGYTALAAFRFVPRFRAELEIIRQAHRVRGAHGGRGPFAAIARWCGYIVPLLAGAIRHAERVALSMDSRAFGAYPDRTERYRVPWSARDGVVIAVAWLATAATVVGRLVGAT